MYRLLITSNLFLDMPLPTYSLTARSRRRNESLSCLGAVCTEAIHGNYDAVVIGGNLFARPYPSKEAWEKLTQEYQRLQQAGIRLLLVEGDSDKGPFYRENVHSIPVLAEGQSRELLPGLTVSNSSITEIEGKELRFWGGETPPPVIPKGALVVMKMANNIPKLQGVIRPGIPLKINFEIPEEASVTRVEWEDGLKNTENIPILDRIYVTFHWNVDERGKNIVSYLEENQDPELALRIIITGVVSEPLPIDAWFKRFCNAYFLLVLEDRAQIVQTESCPPLVHELFNNHIAEVLSQPDLKEEQRCLYRRAWNIGQTALKGGKRHAN